MIKEFTFEEHELENLNSAYSEVQSLCNFLDSRFVSDTFIEKVQNIISKMRKGLDSYHQALIVDNAEHAEFNAKLHNFDEIRKDNDFLTVWSMYDISSVYEPIIATRPDLIYRQPVNNQTIGSPIDKWIFCYEYFDIYGFWRTETIPYSLLDSPEEIMWIELWKIAEELVIRSDDKHHIYIEGFEIMTEYIQSHSRRRAAGYIVTECDDHVRVRVLMGS